MSAHADYEAAIDVVGSVINAWDPYSLLTGGAPLDEFHSEIARLATRIKKIHSPSDAAREISSVFSTAFEPEKFTVTSCGEVGLQLYSRLQEAGLLATRGI